MFLLLMSGLSTGLFFYLKGLDILTVRHANLGIENHVLMCFYKFLSFLG
jgi:hypothetical protein